MATEETAALFQVFLEKYYKGLSRPVLAVKY